MSEALNDIREADGIAEVQESNIPGVDYCLVAESRSLRLVRTLWLRELRDDFEWAGKSENGVEPAFALLTRKEQ